METGIENVKKVLLWGAKLSEAIVDALVDDGKINFGEGFDIALKAVGIPFKSIKPMIAEFKDLDETERLEVTEAFAEEFDIANEDAEVKVEQAIAFILSLIDMITVKAAAKEV